MTNEIFMKIISAIVTIICALISAYLVPWIRAKITAEQMAQITDYAIKAVRAAEQLYTPEQWQQKKQHVLEYMLDVINDKFRIRLTIEDIDTLIEGVVNEVKKG